MEMLCMQTFHFNIKKRILWRFKRSLLNRVRSCCLISKSSTIRDGNWPPASPSKAKVSNVAALPRCSLDSSSDLVSLKISVYGDCNIGKTSFLMKYGGEDKGDGDMRMRGINHVDKTLYVEGVRICYNIWEVGGKKHDQIPAACNQSMAMFFMFDLTSRCTLNSVIQWYRQARKWNQNAIPILIGTKFDEFMQLPIDLQWAISSEARAYAKVMNATLFFSSATYNINVNKIFKFVTAKLFNLHWNLERNLTIGEPIIDF